MVSPCAGQNPGEPAAPAAQATDTTGFERVVLTAGRSTVLNTPFDVTRIAVTNPAVADAVVVQPREVLIDGKSAGTVSLIVWGGDQRRQYDVVVDPGVTTLQQSFQELFPGEDTRVAMNDESIILTGSVSSNAVMLRAGEIADAMSSKTGVVNMLQLPGGSESQQVMLQVRIAEVNRKAIQELGVNLFSTRPEATGRITTQQFSAPSFDDQKGGLNFSDFLNLFFFNRKKGCGVGNKGSRAKGNVPNPPRAEPDCLQRPGGQLSRRRRVSCARGAGRRCGQQRDDHVQGVRREAELQTDDCGRCHPPQGASRSQLTRLQQRHHAPRLPGPGADPAPRRDR